jgi:hypothetical protein
MNAAHTTTTNHGGRGDIVMEDSEQVAGLPINATDRAYDPADWDDQDLVIIDEDGDIVLVVSDGLLERASEQMSRILVWRTRLPDPGSFYGQIPHNFGAGTFV